MSEQNSEKTPEERQAEALTLAEAGDNRPVSQIVAENLAQEQAGQTRDEDGNVVKIEDVKDEHGKDKHVRDGEAGAS